ncbi:hypothetical protein HY477_01790 [Candidatus Uhrbacteria bacterium]|nr:hypothetical protein [Candidatus Uhrbacteria bacterium]
MKTNIFNPPTGKNGGYSVNIGNLFLLLVSTLVNVTLEALAYLTFNATGTRVEFGLLKSGETLGTYAIPRRGHALFAVANFDGTLAITGTRGVTGNSAFATGLNWVMALMSKANKAVAFLAPPQGTIGYYVRHASGKIVEITNWGFDQLSMVNGKGLLVRVSGSNDVYFLSARAIRDGATGQSSWKRITVPCVGSIETLPVVIDDPANVFCKATIDERPAAVMLDASNIENGVIRQVGDATTDIDTGATVLGRAADDSVVIDASANSRNFKPGISRADASTLQAAFGDVGTRLVRNGHATGASASA